MATSKEFIDYICEQIAEAGNIENKKMFGDYMIYCDSKPVLLVCDNTIFVKQLPEVEELFSQYEKIFEVGIPYEGAKPYYIVDVEDNDFAIELIRLLARILPMPKPKKKAKS